ncbi:MAG: xylulokinase [Alphaproteobacteria bacterium]
MSGGGRWLGLDIGTSGVKAVLVDDADRMVAEASAPLTVDRPRPGWSEQDPDAWWRAAQSVLDRLAAGHRPDMARVGAIGLSGQMLGVAPVDADGRPLRPALLWNDARAVRAGAALEAAVQGFASITGARAMPGFSAPKIRWLRENEPSALDRARWVLLPKDVVRLHLTGEAVSDRADASATLLMATREGDWHAPILAAAGIDRARLPTLVDSGTVAAALRPALSARWGLPQNVPVAGGAGDNMCGGIGAGVDRHGAAYVSLGTSAVVFIANRAFVPSLGQGMHTHRHGVAGLYCQQAVALSAAAALSWIAGILGAEVGALVAEVDAAAPDVGATPVFTPYLAGERTPHDDASLTGAFSGLSLATGRAHLVQAVMEGVALAIADCRDALASTGADPSSLALVGGGARSRRWADLIASALERPLTVPPSAAVGPALGAARLARLAAGGPLVARAAEAGHVAVPDRAMADALHAKRARYRAHLTLARGE